MAEEVEVKQAEPSTSVVFDKADDVFSVIKI